MGVIAFARQAMYDAESYRRQKLAWQGDSSIPRTELVPNFEALASVLTGESQPFIDDLNEVTFFQAQSLANLPRKTS